jgi:NAD(P)-dependent dehydrogenase (short-subunit alcohol dehydrogenase family)
MTHHQRPLGTGFTAASTASEVLRGIDLTGKNVIVTGGNGRLGLETTRALAQAGASVTVAARNLESAGRAIADIPRAEVSQLDLVDPRSIDGFAERWLASQRPLHILVNSATSFPIPPERTLDARGYEIQLATSHLGHFQLTLALLPALRAAHGARVVNLSSGAQRFGIVRWDDPHFATGGYAPHVAYAQAKMANVLFTVELDRRFAKEGIRAFAVHPGVIVDPQTPGTSRFASLRAQGLLDEAGAPIIDPERGKKTVQQGASTIVLAAASPLLDDIGGVYLKDNDVSRTDDEPRPLTPDSIPSEVTSRSIEPESARRLWDLSEELLKK